MDRGAWRATSIGSRRVRHGEDDSARRRAVETSAQNGLSSMEDLLLHTVRGLEPAQLTGAVEDPGFRRPRCGRVSSCPQSHRCCSIC